MTDAYLIELKDEGIVVTYMRPNDTERRVYATWAEAARDLMREMDE